MQSWTDERGAFIEIDYGLVGFAFDKMERVFPPYEQLVPPTVSLTSNNIIAVRSEHGKWHASEYEAASSLGTPEVREVGVAVDWRSDAHPVPGSNPCYEAALYIGIPGDPNAHWGLDRTETAASVCLPERDLNTGELRDGEEVAREAYQRLIEVVSACL